MYVKEDISEIKFVNAQHVSLVTTTEWGFK